MAFGLVLSLVGYSMVGVSMIVVHLKLTPSPEQAAVLAWTLGALNDHATRVAHVAHEQGMMRNYELRKLTYQQLRGVGVGSQAAQHVIKKVCDAYRTRRSNLNNGNYGPKGSGRRKRIESTPIVFRPGSAHPYDQRNLSFAVDARTISLWTFQGRLKDVAFTGSPEQIKMLSEYKRGECDLICQDGSWFLAVTLDVPDAEEYEPASFLGADLGIANIATTSDVQVMAGRKLNRYRRRQQRLRAKLQSKDTKSAKRLLKKHRRREARHIKDTNHQISKRIVAEAERTGRGISLEELKGIRTRVRPARRPPPPSNDGLRPQSFSGAPTGHAALLVLCPAGPVPDLQGAPCGCAGGVHQPRVHVTGVRRVWVCGQEEPGRSGYFCLPGLRRRCARGPECFP